MLNLNLLHRQFKKLPFNLIICFKLSNISCVFSLCSASALIKKKKYTGLSRIIQTDFTYKH